MAAPETSRSRPIRQALAARQASMAVPFLRTLVVECARRFERLNQNGALARGGLSQNLRKTVMHVATAGILIACNDSSAPFRCALLPGGHSEGKFDEAVDPASGRRSVGCRADLWNQRKRNRPIGRGSDISLSDLCEVGRSLQSEDRNRSQLSVDRIRRRHCAN